MIICKDYSTFYTTTENDTTIYNMFCSLYSGDVPSPLPTSAVGIENFPQNLPLENVRFACGSTLYCANTGDTYMANESGEFIKQPASGGGITPTGNIDITDTQVTDVTNYATAQVVDANLVAENIKDGVTILGKTGTLTADKPQLFPPIITGGINSILWANNINNGAYAVTLAADVDGTPVTSPLTITQDMNGKRLTVSASAENFESVSTSIVIVYITEDTSLYAAPNNTNLLLHTSNVNFKNNDDDAGWTGRIFVLYNEQDTTYYTTDELEVAYIPSTGQFSINAGLNVSGGTGHTPKTGFCNNDAYIGSSGNAFITGTVIVRNKTTGVSQTFNFNHANSASSYGITNFLHVGDKVTFIINLSAVSAT